MSVRQTACIKDQICVTTLSCFPNGVSKTVNYINFSKRGTEEEAAAAKSTSFKASKASSSNGPFRFEIRNSYRTLKI